MLVTPELNKVASADEVFSTPAAAPVVPTAKQVNREAKRLFREAVAVQSEPCENMDLTTLESDLVSFLRGGKFPNYCLENDAQSLADGATEAELAADCEAFFALRAHMTRRLLEFITQEGAVLVPAKKDKAAAEYRTKTGRRIGVKISVHEARCA